MARLLVLFLSFSAYAFAQLAITPPTLPNGYQGSYYAATQTPLPTIASINLVDLDVAGSSGFFSFSVISGSLPPGMSLSTFGSLRGAPTAQGTFNFTVRASQPEGPAVTRAYSLIVRPPFSESQTATVGTTLVLPVQCPPFDTSYTYSGLGNIPDGLMVEPQFGFIYGVPEGPPGKSTFRWLCQDSSIQFRVDFTFDIRPRPTLSYNAEVGSLFGQTILIDGGTPPFSYRVVSGDPPPGLALDSRSGLMGGIPEMAGVYTFIVEKEQLGAGDVYQVLVTIDVKQGLTFTIDPETLSLRAISDGPPATASVTLESNLLGDAYSVLTRTTRGGNWLTATPAQGSLPKLLQVRANPSGLPPGEYAGFVDAQSAAAPGPAGQAQLQVLLTVLPPQPDELTLEPTGLQASFRQGAGPRVFQVSASNSGSGPILFDAQTATANGGPWLSVSPSTGTASGASPVTMRVTMDPGGLAPGTYKGTVTVNAPAAGGAKLIPVTMTVTGERGLLELSRTGFSYRMEQGSNPPAGFTFIRESQGRALAWQATATTTSAGSWLVATPSSGTTGPQSLSNVVVSGSRLAPGRYFGQVAVSSSEAANSPQLATVALRVDPTGTLLGPIPAEHGLAFVSPPTSSTLVNRLTRGVPVANPTARTQTLLVASSFPGGPTFFNATAAAPRIAPGEQIAINVNVNASSLAVGIYRGFVELAFESGGPHARVEVLLVVAPGASGGPVLLSEETGGGKQQGACTPSAFHVINVSPGDNFFAEQGLPVAIEAFVLDNCGNVPGDATVWARFTNGDAPLALTRNSRGGYSGVWTPVNAAVPSAPLKDEPGARPQQNQEEDQDNAQITIQANQLNTTGGATQIGGALSVFAGVPVISPGGAVSAASFAARNPLPPGGFVSIFGGNLAPATQEATVLPLPTQLSQVSVTAAGQPVPLTFVSPGQINGVLPFELTADTAQQIVVKNGNALSTPEQVSVSQAQPAVFTQNFSGLGPGIVVGVRPDGSQFLVGPGSRLSVGDAAVIYCAGLGLVDQEIDAAAAAPGDPLARTLNGVSVTIGGVDAGVFFAGLAPGFAGLYQVNAIVQAGTPSGAEVPLVLTVNDIANPTVTVAVQ